MTAEMNGYCMGCCAERLGIMLTLKSMASEIYHRMERKQLSYHWAHAEVCVELFDMLRDDVEGFYDDLVEYMAEQEKENRNDQ